MAPCAWRPLSGGALPPDGLLAICGGSARSVADALTIGIGILNPSRTAARIEMIKLMVREQTTYDLNVETMVTPRERFSFPVSVELTGEDKGRYLTSGSRSVVRVLTAARCPRTRNLRRERGRESVCCAHPTALQESTVGFETVL
jgi:hypothetical protein